MEASFVRAKEAAQESGQAEAGSQTGQASQVKRCIGKPAWSDPKSAYPILLRPVEPASVACSAGAEEPD